MGQARLVLGSGLESVPAVGVTLMVAGGCYLVPAGTPDDTTETTETETTEPETTESETTDCPDCPDHPLDSECGDGVVDDGEACDDGNDVDTDACTNSCNVAVCGDGIVHVGVEQCEDGNDIDGDGCTNACTVAACGDGIVYVGAEECDDGNLEDGDACVECMNAVCGDGVVQAGLEECDGGSDCLPTCRTCADSDIKAIATGGHTCALLGCGLVECWGSGADGRLGYGNTENVGDMLTPVEVGPLGFSFAAIENNVQLNALALGDSHGCAWIGSRMAPDIACWGNGGNGRLGYGDTANLGDDADDLEPSSDFGTAVPLPLGVNEYVQQVAAGAEHTCVLTSTLRVLCWGKGENGRLGYGDEADVLDVGGLSEVDLGGGLYGIPVAITAGGAHTCVLLQTDGTSAVCWGSDASGQLGNGGSMGDVLEPEPNSPVPVEAFQISAGAEHTCAVVGFGGAVQCWGEGDDGRLGYGATNDVDEPTGQLTVNLGGRHAESVVAGAMHSCALTTNGEVLCWGYNGDGRLGYGDTTTRYEPDGVVLDNVLQIAAGGAHTCALLGRSRAPVGEVACWGFGGDGRLGYGNTMQINAPGLTVQHR